MERTDTSAFDSGANADTLAARLIVEEVDHPARTVLLVAGAAVRIGRSDELEVCLDDGRVSRVHATVRYNGRAVTLEDNESSNGTWIGDRRVQSPEEVGTGAQFRVGATRVTVLLPARSTTTMRMGGSVGDDASGFLAVDPASVALLDLARRLGPSELPVLLQGETGTGKELLARTIHRYSPRASKPFAVVPCATLEEAGLFGEEGDDAVALDAMRGGTLLLDEVGDLSAPDQARLLRVLQDRSLMPVGATRAIPVDVRVMATTTRDLAKEVSGGRFREDLYFRLNGVTVEVPPLRARPRDILPLAQRALDESGSTTALGAGVTAVLTAHRWPGNVRELLNAVSAALAVSRDNTLRVENLPASVRGESGAQGVPPMPLRERVDETERKAIVAALEGTKWNQSRAARVLGISRRALIYKMERYGLKPLPNSQRNEP